MSNNLLTVEQVASLFKVSQATIKRWDRSGKISVIRINKRGDRRYPESEVQKFIDQGMTRSNQGRK